jgi:regulator of extracellular matrix RemA (YlzA/DUF370 family)
MTATQYIVGLKRRRDYANTRSRLIDNAIGHLDGARKTRATEILDQATALLAELDRLRAAL